MFARRSGIQPDICRDTSPKYFGILHFCYSCVLPGCIRRYLKPKEEEKINNI